MSEGEDSAVRSDLVAVLRFSGYRFEDAGGPTSSLVEIVSFQALLAEVAKALFRRDNQRQRVPAGWEAQLDVRLTRIEDGSFMPVLERVANLDTSADVLFDWNAADYVDKALVEIEEFIQAASLGSGFPSIFDDVPNRAIKRFGQKLQPGDSLQVSGDISSVFAKPVYDSSTRRAVLQRLGETFEDEVVLVGTLTALDLRGSLFGLDVDGQILQIPYSDGNRSFLLNLLSAAPDAEFKIDAIVERDSRGEIVRVRETERIQVASEIGSDYFRALSGLNSIVRLESGWLDGEEGEPIDGRAIETANVLLTHLSALGVPAPELHPSLEAGVYFEWGKDNWAYTFEIIESGDSIVQQETDTDTAQFDYRESRADAPGIYNSIGWLIERLQK